MAERLTDSIPFLLHCVAIAGVEFATADFAGLGVGVAEARVLIATLQNRDVRAGQLSELTHIAQSTLSHMLRRLAEQGLLTRVREEKDNRAVTVKLTPAGRRIARQCESVSREHERVTVSGMDSEKIQLLRRLLNELLVNVTRNESQAAR